ncbi:MAG: alpha/beta fold hydrolase [Rhizobiaceae bacterium]|nr:alpha/beta fold hydrolase [Rhizobiaceae bacterium]MCV0407782.1 alpha/beta fold hydrolase [Rhizobiaceae bacterium]
MADGLYARVKGSGTTAMVLLHGFGGGCDDWYDIQPDLARDGLVLAYDLPGHGRSLDHPAAGVASAMAKAILADLAERGIDRAHVAGFSMGGAVACLMGLREPSRVASLTLLAPGGFGPEINGPLLERFATPADADELRAAMNGMAAPAYRFETKHVAALAARRRIDGQKAMLQGIHGMIARDGRQGEIPRETLATLAMPVTVVWGTADPVLPYSHSRNLPASFRFISLDDVGHMLLMEARKPVTAAIRSTVRSA